MSQRRHAFRFTVRSTARRATRTAIRVCWHAPDDLGLALSSYRRAIRAHRRLARLAPRFFDSAIVERERRERDDRRRWRAEWEPALDRVYGCESKPHDPAADLPPLPPPQTQRAVEQELAAWNFWMSTARMAMDRYRQRRPHDLMNFSRLARLLDIGFEFAQIACGFDPNQPLPEPSNFDAARADLERVYGHQSDSAPSSSDSLSASPAAESSQASISGLLQAAPSPSTPTSATPSPTPSPPDLASQPAAPSLTVTPRCDTWSRWARRLRHRTG